MLAARLVERNVLVYRHAWIAFVSGFGEPVLYLFSIGVGLGTLVGRVGGSDYPSFVAPAMLAAAAMNGAVFDATFGVFFKLRYTRLYDAVLATPLRPRDVAVGEICWALLRGGIYAAVFLLVMAVAGYVHSAQALLVLPTATLIGFAFAALGMAATTFMTSWQDFEYIALATLPLFLFSATFYPLATYPPAGRLVVQLSPLYSGVALVRGLTLGTTGPTALGHAGYLLALGCLGVVVTSRRLDRLLLR
jgi:lipooligosaccharide transport system permease protein